jgi:hypothetical protein
MTEVPGNPDPADPLGLRHLAKLGDAIGSICNNMIEQVSRAIGITYSDLMIVVRARRQARAIGIVAPAEAAAEAYRRIILARADREIAVETALQNDALEERARRRTAAAVARQQENIEEIVVAAIEHVIELGQKGTGSPAPPDGKPADDWMAEFVDMCKNANDSNMRQLWGRVLASETRRPGSFSTRALFTLKMLGASEAEQFRVAVNFLLQGDFIYCPSDNEAASEFGQTHSSFLTLASAGLIAPDPHAGWRIGEGSDRNVVIVYEPYLLFFKREETSAPFEISTWPLTAVGRELAGLITVEHNWNYVKRLAAEVEPAGWRLDLVLTPCGFPPPPDLPTQTQPR